MPDILFSHPQVPGTLVVNTGANEIAWGYNLNTATYPTYAGEVVQVLSTNIDNLTITGEVRTVAKMEEIYKWFLYYMQVATQGPEGTDELHYSEYAVKMQYPHRGWTLYIMPIALPGLTYGRDVVVPTWQIQAHILDPDPDMTDLTIDSLVNFGDLYNFKNMLTADVGYREANPYSDPLGVLNDEEHKLFPDWKPYKGQDARDDLSGIAQRLRQMVEQYVSGTFTGVTDIMESYGMDASKPADKSTSASSGADQEKHG